MRVHFLTTKLADASGGAIYDNNFYGILKQCVPEVKLFDDDFFTNKMGGNFGLKEANLAYRKYEKEIFNCDYLIMNSRIYTRFLLLNLKKILRHYSHMKLIVIHHHNNYMMHTGILRMIHRHYEMTVLKAANQLVIPNQYVIDQLQAEYKLKNIVCLPSSFEKKQYEISKLNSKNILFVGNVEKRKGLIYGLKAFHLFYQNNKEYTFRIAGKYDENDSCYKELKEYIVLNGLDNAVIFEGRVSDERLDWLYSNSDLFLFPSLLEGYGWVMIEAMGRGLPVVAFNNSAMPYTVRNDYNGMLIENLNWEDMGNTLTKILPDSRKLKKMQQGALETYGNVPSQEQLNVQTADFIKSWK